MCDTAPCFIRELLLHRLLYKETQLAGERDVVKVLVCNWSLTLCLNCAHQVPALFTQRFMFFLEKE